MKVLARTFYFALIISFLVGCVGNKNEKLIVNPKALQIPNTEDILVLRTDFSSEDIWKEICHEVLISGNSLGFKPYVEFVSDQRFEGFTKDVITKNSIDYNHLFLFVIDSTTMNHYSKPILCIDLYERPNLSFRTIPSEMWSVQNNLSISNLDLDEFMNACDEEGIFRGFE